MRNEAGKGNISIGQFSSLRKLMRAARRGKIPDERLVIIHDAEANAAKRPLVYMHSMARGWANFRAARAAS